MSLFYTSVRWCVSLRGLFQHVWTCLRRNVCYVLRRTHGRFSALHAPINTKSERLPQASPPPPPPPPNPPSPATSTTLSVGKPHWNVFKRHSSSHKQASSSTGMWGGDNGEGGGGVSARRRLLFLLEATKCVYVFASICVFLSHSSSVSSEYTQWEAVISTNYPQARRESRGAFLLSTTTAQVRPD